MSTQEQISASQQLIRNARNARAKDTAAECRFESDTKTLLRSFNTPVESEEEELTGTEKKEIMLAALVQYGCMSISEISEKAPELTPGEVRSLGMGLENQGLVRRARRREDYSYVDCYEACV